MGAAILPVVLSIVSALALFLGLIVILRNPRKLTNQVFLGLTLSMAAWIITNAVFQRVPDDLAYPIALASYVGAASTSVFTLQFARLFTGRKLHKLLFVAGLVWAIAVGMPNFVATSVVNHAIRTTPFLLLYALLLVGHLGAALWLFVSYRNKTRGAMRERTNLILLGLVVSVIGGTFFNLFLPLFGGVYDFVAFGPAAALIFASSLAIAIVKHRLFDVRRVVLRSLSYLMLIVVVSILYVGIVLNVGASLLGATDSGRVQTFYVLTTLLLAISFQNMRHLFDHMTNRFFFRDAYDTKAVLDKISNSLVASTDLTRALKEVIGALDRAMRPVYVDLCLLEGSILKRYVHHSEAKKWDKAIDEVYDYILQHQPHILVRDEVVESESAPIAKLLDSAATSVVVRLQTPHETVGYLIVGQKQSGNIFNQQDIDLLKIAADQIAIAVQNGLRFIQIQHFTETLQQRVENATAELQVKNQRLRELDKVKDEFISMASHQLRTPLTAVKGYISMVLDGDGGPLKPPQRKLLGEAFTSTQRMTYLIADFLNVSRIHTGKFVIERKPVVLSELIKGEISQLQATAKNRGLTLIYHPPVSFPALMLDEDKTRQVIMNFIDNAIYYTPAGGTIRVELTATDKEVRLIVQDTGIGVPKSERHQLFTKFFRASNARRMRPDGTGIGLYLARKVIVGQGGAIIFTSEVGKGSTFGFSFPLHSESSNKSVD